MPRDKTSKTFNVTVASLDAFVKQLCFLRQFRGRMSNSPVYANTEGGVALHNSPFRGHLCNTNQDSQTSTPYASRLKSLLHLDLSPIHESDSSFGSHVDGIPPSPRNRTPRSPARSVTPRQSNRSRQTSLRTPGRDGDGSYLNSHECDGVLW
ncbi:hypothetical protein Q1695_000686 [Nippostrongylus brasiliensis]|nr:hypothetical protein Q1695_000686 [Nippostrongylus brasiliensis]